MIGKKLSALLTIAVALSARQLPPSGQYAPATTAARQTSVKFSGVNTQLTGELFLPANGDKKHPRGPAVILLHGCAGMYTARGEIAGRDRDWAQGGNIYRSLRIAGIKWAKDFKAFSWPRLIPEDYKRPEKMEKAITLRDEFLRVRAAHMTCANAYPSWPRSARDAWDFVAPGKEDVLADWNIRRLAAEVPKDHRVILVCGVFAWLACLGIGLKTPALREGTPLAREKLAVVNKRLHSHFQKGWYMGHTRRWLLHRDRLSAVLRAVTKEAGW